MRREQERSPSERRGVWHISEVLAEAVDDLVSRMAEQPARRPAAPPVDLMPSQWPASLYAEGSAIS